MGGNQAPTMGFFLGFAFYLQSARWPLHVERVPYKLMLATLGYAIGVNIGGYYFGDRTHCVYYTPQERAVIA
jgi:hypothetical protein